MENKKTAKVDWVFWLNIQIRRKWFKLFWKTRGANYLEIQLLIFKISIGQPWLETVMTYKDYYNENIYETNMSNLKAPFSILMKRK